MYKHSFTWSKMASSLKFLLSNIAKNIQASPVFQILKETINYVAWSLYIGDDFFLSGRISSLSNWNVWKPLINFFIRMTEAPCRHFQDEVETSGLCLEVCVGELAFVAQNTRWPMGKWAELWLSQAGQGESCLPITTSLTTTNTQ